LDADGDDTNVRVFLFTFQNGAAPLASSFGRPFFYAGKVFAHCHLNVFGIMVMALILEIFGLSVVVVASGWLRGNNVGTPIHVYRLENYGGFDVQNLLLCILISSLV
jgi:hypothetical protein